MILKACKKKVFPEDANTSGCFKLYIKYIHIYITHTYIVPYK